MPRLEQIPFRLMPNQSRLFLDYVAGVPDALGFYGTAPSRALIEETARTVAASGFTARGEIASVLESQNRRFGADPVTAGHIDDLRAPDSVAIVTGQQVGLFSGPLYTFYKALTTIRIAADLRQRGIRAVPVFWMDTEDHDLEEITHVTLLPPGGTPRKSDYRTALYGGKPAEAIPVGSRELPESVAWVVGEFLAALPGGDYTQPVAEALEAAYAPGATFTEAFARFLAWLFRGHGLVMFDPDDHGAKQLLREVFSSAVRGAGDIYARMAERNRELERFGYHTQVSVQEQSTVLFLRHGGERRALIRDGSGFGLKNTDVHFTTDELTGLAGTNPELFSPNVLLRPVVQDTLFPTVAYVAGPAEVAYFAQIQTLYEPFGRRMPVIWPRSSLTLVEPEVSKRMEEHGLTFVDCLSGKEDLVRKMVSAGSDSISVLADLRRKVDSAVELLQPRMAATDASLGPALGTAARKLASQIEGLQAKFVHFEAARNGELERVAEMLLAHIRPNGILQERELNVSHFLPRFGPALVEEVFSVIGTGQFAHSVVRL
jgi:bacillithiol synthase